MEIHVRIEGLEKLSRKLDNKELLGKPLKEFFEKATVAIQRNVMTGTPVDTGNLRANITQSVDSSSIPMWGEIGTLVKYAPFVEYGTRPHFPPVGAIAPWARRHGLDGLAFVIARAISRRGTRAWHMFRRGFDNSVGAINGYLRDLANDIEGIWKR